MLGRLAEKGHKQTSAVRDGAVEFAAIGIPGIAFAKPTDTTVVSQCRASWYRSV